MYATLVLFVNIMLSVLVAGVMWRWHRRPRRPSVVLAYIVVYRYRQNCPLGGMSSG